MKTLHLCHFATGIKTKGDKGKSVELKTEQRESRQFWGIRFVKNQDFI